MDLSAILELAVIIVGVYLFLKLLSAPLKLAIKLLLHAGLGFLLLIVEEIIGGFFNFSLGITFLNCLIAGILGIPGVIILVLLKIFM
jgi:inhibitor of the pro-sigma K processing machinery